MVFKTKMSSNNNMSSVSGKSTMLQKETEELVSSELGTQEYWDNTYLMELKNYKAHNDVGEVWFGEESALRVIRWLCSSVSVKQDDKVIDLGCGNGMLLIELAREGFTNLTGVDYSQNAIDLAVAVAKSQDLTIDYHVDDILVLNSKRSNYTVALDKGTYDAISLHPDNSKEKREEYINNVWGLLKPCGMLIITSCNWTEQELVLHFTPKFLLLNVIPTPTFQFGGKSGNLFTSVVFQKKHEEISL